MTGLRQVLEQLTSGARQIQCAGLSGSSKAYLISHLLKKEGKSGYVYVSPSIKEADRILNDLSFFGVKADLFPPYDALPFSGLSPHTDILCQRAGLRSDASQPSVLVTTATALLSPLPPPALYKTQLLLRKEEEVNREGLIQKLLQWGYQKVPLTTDRGTFAVRGGILDIFTPSHEKPLRLEWYGDWVESIRLFEVTTQKSAGELPECKIIPCREVILCEEQIQLFQKKIRERAENRDIPKSHWGSLVEKVKAGIFFAGIETYLPFFYEEGCHFWDYFPDAIWILDQPFAIRRTVGDYCEEIQRVASSAHSLMEPEEWYGSEDLLERVGKNRCLEFGSFTSPQTINFSLETHEGIRQEIRRKGSEPLQPLAKRISSWTETDRVILIASSEIQKSRLSDLLSPYFPSHIPFSIEIGRLSSGFRLPEEKITYLTDEEIFGPRVHRPADKKTSDKGLSFSSLSEIQEGNAIVHKQHGIGLYRGMLHLQIEGTENDFILLEYRGGDKLYLPVYRLNLIQRYTGGDGAPPIDKLGGTSWITLRKKAEKAIREMAGDLLNLYAARSQGKGHSFSAGNEMFETFEASFPFEETPDQAKAISETLTQMQSDKPMDHLVLGDVGYGKTEVAIRAACLASLNGKQTAVLVPTTLLAFQHWERFSERFKDWPVRVEMLSRFRTAAEQKKVIRELAQGTVDIVIGTHSLLQPNISFKNLGLLVIDEEHRFGVAHKERIKKLRKNVDVLTLSATPIPRTLYMSLVGIRSLSVIETPPTNRLAIRTYVLPFEDSVIREAILREVRRGGQIFFVHNKVETINRMKEYLCKLAPEAKIEIAHGQMKEDELEEVMIRFYHQDFSLLLCTTIIESGIDIPSANTVLINNADQLGLAQIYQIRGRVGRGSHRAFAYLLVPPEKELTADAEKRLQVLQKFSELGSGAELASYDLEIRGAGNLLGKEQSGQMVALGYELYTELLEQAIREIKGEKVLEGIEPELHFKLPAYIPNDYIPDPPVRLEIYRRLASLESEEEIEPILDELRDRFGTLTPEVQNLIEFSAIKTYAKKLRLKQIRYDGISFSYAFDPTSPLPPEALMKLIQKDPKQAKLTPDLRLIMRKKLPPDQVLAETKKFLRELTVMIA